MCNVPAISEETHLSSQERRQRERFQIDVPVHVRPVYRQSEELAEVTRTIDFNRNGMCFIALSNHNHAGMVLFVTLPFSSGALRRKKLLGEVTRIERLLNGAQAIAVKFLSE